MRKLIIVLGCIMLLGAISNCGKERESRSRRENVQKVQEVVEIVELKRDEYLKEHIQELVSNSRYAYTNTEDVRINKNWGKPEEDLYIALINLEYWQRKGVAENREWIEKYSNDIAARIAKNGIDDISEIAIFWNDSRNNRKLKMSFEYSDGGFYVTERVGFK